MPAVPAPGQDFQAINYIDMNRQPIRVPSEPDFRSAQITCYMTWLAQSRGLHFPHYETLWRWSVDDLEGFWGSLWEYFNIRASTPYQQVLASREMPGARWFPGATLNYVDQVFRHSTDQRPAILWGNETGQHGELGWRELERQVASVAGALRRMGVQPGDRVAAYLPNVPQTIVAFLATASLGAIWSVCSPDMGSESMLARFQQIEPRVLIACNGYVYGGQHYDRSGLIADLVESLPTVRHVVWVDNIETRSLPTLTVDASRWAELIAEEATLRPHRVPFDHPLWIVYSSGTTGLPKAIVHGHGGIILEHLKLMALHNDLGPEDRLHWYSSSGWVMWNVQVGGLLTGTTVCIFDGNAAGDAARPDLYTLWRFAAEKQVTFFGAGAAYFSSCRKAGIEPGRESNLGRLRSIGSTGSPLSPDTERWLYESLGSNVWVHSVSGGTDIASAFVGGNRTLPTYLGEMQCRCLGARVEAWNDEGQAVMDEVGELVCTVPMPSMPLFFWNDRKKERYLESYFEMFPGVWRHGDWIRLTPRPTARGAIIYGRSDATINRHGIRMGTAELYRVVEAVPQVLDSLVIDLEYLGRESYMPLFVTLRTGKQLSESLKNEINRRIRTELSPRQVPNAIFAVPEIPRTLSGKKLELPIKKLLLGYPAEKVLDRASMANPDSLAWFVDFARRRAEKHRRPIR
jgi:acetoacetyl-CoA synthetase